MEFINRTGSLNMANSSEPEISANYVGALAFSLLLTLTVVLNTLVLIALHDRRGKPRRPVNVFILNLATCQELVGIFVMPFVIISTIYDDWKNIRWLCQANGFISSTILYGSVFSLCLISMDRLFAIAFVMKYRVNMKITTSIRLVLFIWSMALVFSSPPLLGWSTYEYHPGTYHCSPKWKGWCTYYYFVFFLALVLPFSITCYSYVTIFRIVRKQRRKIFPLRANSVLADKEQEKVKKTSTVNDETTLFESSENKVVQQSNHDIVCQKELNRKKSNSVSLICPPAFFFGLKRHSIACTDALKAGKNQEDGKKRNKSASCDSSPFYVKKAENISSRGTETHGEASVISSDIETIPMPQVTVAIIHSRSSDRSDEKSNINERNSVIEFRRWKETNVIGKSDGTRVIHTNVDSESSMDQTTLVSWDTGDEDGKKTESSSEMSEQSSSSKINRKQGIQGPTHVSLPGYCDDRKYTGRQDTTPANPNRTVSFTEDATIETGELHGKKTGTSIVSTEIKCDTKHGKSPVTKHLQSTVVPLTDTSEKMNERLFENGKHKNKTSIRDKIKSLKNRFNGNLLRTFARRKENTRKTSINREYQVAKTGLILGIIFVICYCPYAIAHTCHNDWEYGEALRHLTMSCVFLYGIISPMIFGLKDKDTRRNLFAGVRKMQRSLRCRTW